MEDSFKKASEREAKYFKIILKSTIFLLIIVVCLISVVLALEINRNFLFIAIGIVSYLFGAIPFSDIVSGKKVAKEWGEISHGAMSTLQKTGSIKRGVLVIFLDALKAFLPVFATMNWFSSFGYNPIFGLVVSSCCVILGHLYSAFIRFKGGRGLSSGLGVMFALNWIMAFACLLVTLISVLLFELWLWHSIKGKFLRRIRENLLGRMVGVGLCLIVIYFFLGLVSFLALLPMMGLIFFVHRERIQIYVSSHKEVLLQRLGIKNGSR